jgi:hypothetical protein
MSDQRHDDDQRVVDSRSGKSWRTDCALTRWSQSSGILEQEARLSKQAGIRWLIIFREGFISLAVVSMLDRT